MSETFIRAFYYTLKNEGGYSNDSNDPGGVTNFGISLAFLKDMYKKGMKEADVNGDGVIDRKDIKNISYGLVQRLYRSEFWDKVKMIPNDILAIKVFDAGVNVGIGRAIRMLQKCVNTQADGIIGPATSEAIKKTDTNKLIKEFIIRLKLYYYELAFHRPELDKFLKGWINRAERMPKSW